MCISSRHASNVTVNQHTICTNLTIMLLQRCVLLQLFDALKSNSSVTSVNLTNNHISMEGVQASRAAAAVQCNAMLLHYVACCMLVHERLKHPCFVGSCCNACTCYVIPECVTHSSHAAPCTIQCTFHTC